MKLTESEILAARTARGGWTKNQLAKWGVPWPPPKGWKAQLLQGTKLPHPLKCSKCVYVASTRKELDTHWEEEH